MCIGLKGECSSQAKTIKIKVLKQPKAGQNTPQTTKGGKVIKSNQHILKLNFLSVHSVHLNWIINYHQVYKLPTKMSKNLCQNFNSK